MNAVKRGAEVLISVMLWAVILVAALFAFTTLATKDTNKVASLAGYTPLTVASDSMSPTFRAGDLIVIRKCDPGKLEEGDIITFHTIINNEYALNTHRIAEIQEEGGVRSYVTKGDNNAIADVHMIADGDIVGKFVTKLPGVGKVMSFLSSSIGFLVVIVLPLLVFFIYQVYHLITVSIDLKKAIAVETAQAQAEAQTNPDADALLAEAARAKAEAEKAKAEAEAALAEARRLQEAARAAAEPAAEPEVEPTAEPAVAPAEEPAEKSAVEPAVEPEEEPAEVTEAESAGDGNE